MKVVFIIGTNDVGGAEFVSYHHVLMAYRNGLDVLVLSGTTGKFYDLMKLAGVRIVVTGMTPDKSVLLKYLKDCDVVFNCNFLGGVPMTNEVKLLYGFRHVVILHNNTSWLCNLVVKNDEWIDGYYAIHQKIVDSIAGTKRVDVNKFVVIPNCVDVDQINSLSVNQRDAVRREYGIKDNEFVIGMISRIAGDKNILDAVRILNQLPDKVNAKLMIIGGPSALSASEVYYKKVMQVVQSTAKLRNRVVVTGNKEMADVYRLQSAFDIGFNCSPSEGLPIALLEMMAIGIPCVMPGIGDIPGVLTGRGIVVPLRQRYHANEIFSDHCYTSAEMQLFVNAISMLYNDRVKMAQYGLAAKVFVQDFRSLKYQEKEFLKFIDMGKVKKREGEWESAIKGEIASSPDPDSYRDYRGPRNDGSNDDGANDGHVASLPLAMTGAKDGQFASSSCLLLAMTGVSVLMPTRDGEPEWIEQAVRSIVEQDYAGEIEFVIVAHDCRMSMIAYLEVLVERGKQWKENVRFVLMKIDDPKITFAQALDFGVNECSHEYILRMDHDDIAEKQLISKAVEFMETHKNIPVCGVQIKFFGAKEIVTHHPEVINRELAYQLPNFWFINHPGSMIRKTELLKIGGYGDTPQGFAEDYRLWCKFLKAGYLIANMPDVLLNYRCYKKERVRPEGYMEDLAKAKGELRI